MNTVFDSISSQFPKIIGDKFLDIMSVDDLLEIRSVSLSESPEKETCRPIIQRSEDEARKSFSEIITENSIINIGVYTTDSSPRVIGKITFFDYNPRNRSCELGYYLNPAYRGQGIMKSAASILVPMLFDKGINKIYAQTGGFNEASIRLLEGLGFSKDAVLREHHELGSVLYDDYIFSILKSDWVAAN
ncbi:MAG: GNAT family N-acetyltransferase [Oscillospiraceae bacterium]|nr:GNAT family N-acetyltransferase [Oscillospiraceae bacterium]